MQYRKIFGKLLTWLNEMLAALSAFKRLVDVRKYSEVRSDLRVNYGLKLTDMDHT